MIFDSVLGYFSIDMGIDLGTCNTLVCIRGEGIVLNEPSVVAVKKGTNRVLQNGNAVGLVAKEMLGKTPGSITAIRPLKDGVISDFEVTEAMLKYFIRRAHGGKRLIAPRVVIAIPSGITAVEKRAVLDSAERIKIEIGSAAPIGDHEPTMEVRGRDMISGLPRKTTVTAEEIREALQEPVTQIIEAVTRTLELAEPELAADLVDNGITMAGGSSMLRGLTTVISNATGLDVKLAEDPLTCVARGTSVYLENLELWKDTMESDADEM